jgi:peptide/nickel transport system permease protein
LLLPFGLALLVVGLVALTDQDVWVRAVAVLGGLALAYQGLDAVLSLSFGRSVETGFWLASGWMALVVLAAVFADLLPLAEFRDPSLTLAEPSRLRPDLLSRHPLGTDSQALDLLGGVIYGARVSLQVSLVAVGVGTVLGGVVGMAAAYFRGRLDQVVGMLTDSVLAFPPLVLLLAAVAVLRPSVTTIGLALALVTVPTYVRLARANTLSLTEREYVLAARVQGASHRRILFRELMPNVARPLAAYSFIIVAVLIVAEASLSFLGVGIQRPTPTWGNMIAAGQTEFERMPHLVFVPGLVMFITVFALNQLGDRARAFWDTRETNL